jgi:F-box protein 9
MDPKDVHTNTEAELESFRQKWREEVTARSKGKAPAATSSSSSKPRASKSNAPDPHSHAHQRSAEEVDEVNPYAYHDLGEKQHGRRLDETSAQTAAGLAANQEPDSALEHYEKAVEKESQGKLGDSVAHYRRAFKVRITSVWVEV